VVGRIAGWTPAIRPTSRAAWRRR